MRFYLKIIAVAILLFCVLLASAYLYYFTPEYSRVGYQPVQPVSFSHSTHCAQLNIDCRYCHYRVEYSRYAGIPEASLCLNCHNQALATDPRLELIRNSVKDGAPVEWIRVHRVADYVYFNHAAHTRRGIRCIECHGDVQNMPVVYQAKSLSMKFCLDCHRNPAPYIVPLDMITSSTDLREFAKNQFGKKAVKEWNIIAGDDCSVCHR